LAGGKVSARPICVTVCIYNCVWHHWA